MFSLWSPCEMTGEETPPVANKNWGPGNYIASGSTNNANIWNKPGSPVGNKQNRGILQRLADDPGGKWKGALLRFSWAKQDVNVGDYLEGDTLGDYTAGFDAVESYLNQMAAYPGKRLIIFIQLKTFGVDNHAVPLYMRNSATYADGKNYYSTINGAVQQGSRNGEYAYESSNGGPGGYVPNMHVAAVRARFEALMTAFATRFNDNPYIEAIAFTEASIAQPIGSVGAASETVGGKVITRPNTDGSRWADKTDWYDKTAISLGVAKTALSNVQMCQWINADRIDMTDYVPKLRAAGIGLGMPDCCNGTKDFFFRNDTGQPSTNIGNIQHCQESAGLTIIMGCVSVQALDGVVSNRCQTSGTIQSQPTVYPAYPGAAISRQAERDFAVTDSTGPKVTHLLWTHQPAVMPQTGAVDPNIPPSCAQNPYTAFTGYGGVAYNKITDDWIQDPGSTVTTVETRPSGW